MIGETRWLARHDQHCPLPDAIRGFALVDGQQFLSQPGQAASGRLVLASQWRRRLTYRQEPGSFAKVEARTGADACFKHAAIQRHGAVSSAILEEWAARADQARSGSMVGTDKIEQNSFQPLQMFPSEEGLREVACPIEVGVCYIQSIHYSVSG